MPDYTEAPPMAPDSISVEQSNDKQCEEYTEVPVHVPALT